MVLKCSQPLSTYMFLISRVIAGYSQHPLHANDKHFVYSLTCYSAAVIVKMPLWKLIPNGHADSTLQPGCAHLRWIVATPQDYEGGSLSLLSSEIQNMVLKHGRGFKKKEIFNFTTGHLRDKLGKHQAVKAVNAHNWLDAMHQYVLTNLSLRDTIRRRQHQPVSCWREQIDSLVEAKQH